MAEIDVKIAHAVANPLMKQLLAQQSANSNSTCPGSITIGNDVLDNPYQKTWGNIKQAARDYASKARKDKASSYMMKFLNVGDGSAKRKLQPTAAKACALALRRKFSAASTAAAAQKDMQQQIATQSEHIATQGNLLQEALALLRQRKQQPQLTLEDQGNDEEDVKDRAVKAWLQDDENMTDEFFEAACDQHAEKHRDELQKAWLENKDNITQKFLAGVRDKYAAEHEDEIRRACVRLRLQSGHKLSNDIIDAAFEEQREDSKRKFIVLKPRKFIVLGQNDEEEDEMDNDDGASSEPGWNGWAMTQTQLSQKAS